MVVAEGVGNKTIAKRLGISEHTVKFHIRSIFRSKDLDRVAQDPSRVGGDLRFVKVKIDPNEVNEMNTKA